MCLLRRYLTLIVGMSVLFSLSLYAEEDQIKFDEAALRARGVDPALASWFSQSARFLPGENRVTLTVNGSGHGKVRVHFSDKGQLCADSEFQKQAGLITPPGYSEKNVCFDIKQAWPQAELHLDPNNEHIDLIVPPQAVIISGQDDGNWIHGGGAGLLNYDAQYTGSSGKNSGLNFSQLDTEAGLNIDDWIIRSRQTYSKFNGNNSLQHQAAYAQRSFPEQKTVLQAGQVSLTNSMFGTGQVVGFQFFPEAALQRNRGGGSLVEGIADTQSVVEVRQSSVLVYSTTVPAGPFSIQSIPLLNTRTDLEVTLTSDNGTIRRFVVPASSLLLRGNAPAPGVSFGAGMLNQYGSNESQLLATAASGWELTPATTLTAGILGSGPYKAVATGLDTQPFNATLWSLQTTYAKDEAHDRSGTLITTTISHNLSEQVGINVNASQQSRGYRELSDAIQHNVQENDRLTSSQAGVGINWSTAFVGSLSFSCSRSRSYNGNAATYLRANWSRQWEQAYVGTSLEHNTDEGDGTPKTDNRLYITISIPFGHSRVTSYVSSSNASSRTGVRYSERYSQDRGWSLASEHDSNNNDTSAIGTADMITQISQLSGNVSQSTGTTNWSTRASGSLVAHAHGVSFSPYRVSDTFGIAKVGEESGVRIETSAGPTWTNGSGYAVLPSINGYRRSSVQIDTRSLAKNVDISNSWQETEAARGSVSYVDFDVSRTRRVLVTANDSRGVPLPHGAAIFDSKGNFVTVVGSNGAVFVPDAHPGMKLTVQNSGVAQCLIVLILPDTVSPVGFYESVSAICR